MVKTTNQLHLGPWNGHLTQPMIFLRGVETANQLWITWGMAIPNYPSKPSEASLRQPQRKEPPAGAAVTGLRG